MMEKIYVSDMHMHSNCSDGFWTPREVVAEAKKRGLKQIALTDHNTIAGLEEASHKAKEIGIEFIDGVEINSAMYYEGEFFESHILALNFNREKMNIFLKNFIKLQNELFEAIIMNLEGARLDENYAQFNSRNSDIQLKSDIDSSKINKYSIIKDEMQNAYLMDVSDEEVDELLENRWFPPHIIARYIRVNLLEQTDYLRNEKPRYLAGTTFSVFHEIFDIMKDEKYFISQKDVIDEIHKAGGIAVLAHPFLFLPLYSPEVQKMYGEMIEELIQDGLDGIETYFYTSHNFTGEEQEDFNNKAAELCKAHNLITTYGSDCHGPKKNDESKVKMGKFGSRELIKF
jgi:predicted metal-dependent phosphoesterase TrpH